MANTTIIVGGGVVGLNIALHLSEQKKGDIFILEREKFLGHHTSTRNSEVMHGGFAYEPGSLKAKLCVEGNRLSFELLQRLNVAYKREGKWIVAANKTEEVALARLMENAKACGVPGIRMADIHEFSSKCPLFTNPRSVAFSATSGIIDGSGYIRAMEVALSNREGVYLVYPCAVNGIDARRGIINTDRGEMSFDFLVNAGGLFADDVYKMAGGLKDYEIRPFKGEYYTWRKGRVDGLIYPVSKRFLNVGDATKVSSMGVHLHRSVAGELYIGPTEIEMQKNAKTDYSITTTAKEISKQVAPLLKEEPDPDELEQGFAGNRPKLFLDGKPIGDFVIFREGNIVHLLGIESPGLTAAPAIARYVGTLL